MSQLEMFEPPQPLEPLTVDTISLDPTVVNLQSSFGEDFLVSIKPPVDYKFRENELINEFQSYIDDTYSGHYGHGGFQSSEVIIDRGHGLGFFLGNVDKYNARYGKKGTPSEHRKDLMKIIHYGFLALYEHDRIHNERQTSPEGSNI
tara:strand:- start:61 stop:501 length:441 start_codon:yes stop_codon:yes gene_type:complete